MNTTGKAFAGAGAIILGIVVVVSLCVLAWAGYWFLARSSEGHQAHIRRSTFQAQDTARTQVRKGMIDVAAIEVQLTDPSISDATKDALTAQEKAIINQTCQVADRIEGDVSDDIQKFVLENC